MVGGRGHLCSRTYVDPLTAIEYATDMSASIWHQPFDVDVLNSMCEGSMVEHLEIRFTEVGADFLRATMPVDARSRQPLGILHGGASVTLAETVGSVGANGCVDQAERYCVGLDINANHIRVVREGMVVATGRPLHLGRGTQVWQINIENEDNKLVCASRLTMIVLDKPEERS